MWAVRSRSRSGCDPTRSANSSATKACSPSSSRVSACSSSAVSRCSSRRSAAVRANSSSTKSANAGPRHRASASVSRFVRVRGSALWRARVGVDGAGRDHELVAGRAGDHQVPAAGRGVLQRPAQLPHLVLQDAGGVARQPLAPQVLDQPVHGHGPATVDQQRGEQSTHLQLRHPHRPPLIRPHRQRAEHPETHVITLAEPGGPRQDDAARRRPGAPGRERPGGAGREDREGPRADRERAGSGAGHRESRGAEPTEGNHA